MKPYYDIGFEIERKQTTLVVIRVTGAADRAQAGDAARSALSYYLDHVKDTRGGALSSKKDPIIKRFSKLIRDLNLLWKAPRGWARRLKIGECLGELSGASPDLDVEVPSETDLETNNTNEEA